MLWACNSEKKKEKEIDKKFEELFRNGGPFIINMALSLELQFPR